LGSWIPGLVFSRGRADQFWGFLRVYFSVQLITLVYFPGLAFSRGPAFSERPCHHYLIPLTWLPSAKIDDWPSWNVPYRTSRCPASLNARVSKCYLLLYQNWRANSPYLFDKQDK